MLPKPQKPHNLRCWKLDTPTGSVQIFTCGRPGRDKGQSGRVSEELVNSWVLGLQEHCGPNLAVISLLGRKNDANGESEFSYYSFCGGFDSQRDHENRPTFQEWLDVHHTDLDIQVCEYPTFDRCPIPLETLDTAAADIRRLVLEGRTVIVVDSGGVTRSGKVCRHTGAVEDFSYKK